MKKFLLIFGYGILSVILLVYAAFLIVPPFISLEKYKPEIQKLVLDNSKLNLDYSKIKIYTTPFLSVGAIIENPEIKLPDGSLFLKSPRIKAGIALPSILTLTVKTSKCYIDEPYINMEIVNDEQYKIVKVIEDIINENNAKPKTENEEKELPIDIEKIKIKVPSVKISNYNLFVNDLKSSHSLSLKGNELILGYNSNTNRVSVKTKSSLYSDDKENVTLDIKIASSLPEIEKNEDEADPEEKIEIPFVNPVRVYQTYDLKTNIVSRLDIKNTKSHGFIAFGFLNVDNLTLKLSDIKLPESYLHSKFSGKKIQYESNIYAKDNEKISLIGDVKYGKKPHLQSTIVSDEIHFTNLLALLKGLLDSLNIKNEIAQINASGYLKANAFIRTNFKKLSSNGSIIVKEGSIVNYKNNIGIKDIAANLIFENNVLNIKDTSATINGSKLTLGGMIDNNSNVNIKLDVNNLSLSALYSAFAPKELKREYLLNSAQLTSHIDIEGKLNDISAKLKTNLSNLSLSDYKKTMFITNKYADINLTANASDVKGRIDDSGFLFRIPSMKTTASVENVVVDVDKNNIVLNPFDLVYNNFSKINIKGKIANYVENPDLDLLLGGSLSTANIKQTLGADIAHYFDSKGSIPAKVTVKGDLKKQNIIAQVYSDSNNYITPVILNELKGSPALVNAEVKLQGNKIKVKNSGLYKKQSAGFSDNLENNMQGAVQIADLTAVIDNNHINLLRLNISKDLSGSLALFKKSSFKTKGKININGYFDNLTYSGGLKIWDINIPEIKTHVKNLDIDLSSKNIDLSAKQVNLNGSKLDGSLRTSLVPSSIIKLDDINVTSDLINVDKTMVVLDELMKYMPQGSSGAANQNANIPLSANGKFNIKKILTGNIDIYNTKGNLEIRKNNLYVNKLTCKAFEGDINGSVIVNLINSLITAKLKGSNVNLDEMLVKTANMKNTLSGRTSFETNISLKGATYLEQVKSLLGTVKFEAKSGIYGPFSKLENFFLAENIRENPVFSNTIGVILSPLTTIDSSRYEKLTGMLSFKNGIANLDTIKSQGDILCVLIKGNMNLVTNEINSNVRVRLASAVSDMLGPLSVANPVNLVKKTPGLNIMTAQLFKVFTQVVLESEYKEIPDFSILHSDSNATKFQIVLKGDTTKPLKLVKSFKWLALQADMDKAQKFSDAYVQEQTELAKQELVKKLQSEYEANNKIKVGVEKVLQMDTTAPAVKKVLVEEVVRSIQTKTTGTSTNSKALESAKQEVKDQIKEAANKKAKEKLDALEEKLKAKAEAKAKANQAATQETKPTAEVFEPKEEQKVQEKPQTPLQNETDVKSNSSDEG